MSTRSKDMECRKPASKKLRVGDLIRSAQAELERHQLDYQVAVALRCQLLRRMALVQQMAGDSSIVVLLQKLTAQAMTLQRQPSRMQPWETTGPAMSIDALPDGLEGYDSTKLERISQMTMGDYAETYRSFLAKVQPMALHASCHGEASAHYHDLERVLKQFATFTALMGCVAAPMCEAHLMSNMETGEENAVPPGWFERVVQLLPVDVEFAQMAVPAVKLMDAVDVEGLAVLQQVSSTAGAQASGEAQAFINQLVAEYGRDPGCSSLLVKTQVCAQVLNSMFEMPSIPCFKIGLVLSSCWPFIPVGDIILKCYLDRPEVVEALASAAEEATGPARMPGSPPQGQNVVVSSALAVPHSKAAAGAGARHAGKTQEPETAPGKKSAPGGSWRQFSAAPSAIAATTATLPGGGGTGRQLPTQGLLTQQTVVHTHPATAPCLSGSAEGDAATNAAGSRLSLLTPQAVWPQPLSGVRQSVVSVGSSDTAALGTQQQRAAERPHDSRLNSADRQASACVTQLDGDWGQLGLVHSGLGLEAAAGAAVAGTGGAVSATPHTRVDTEAMLAASVPGASSCHPAWDVAFR